ncbi:MAG: type II toxin-antitoxin system YoeB family toxin [Puniceicoccales bacterium]|jgi:toxin YoeB|nr:type II toxin-antitoxin system YoeB family toxin [Puniceicoccales bacterium]
MRYKEKFSPKFKRQYKRLKSRNPRQAEVVMFLVDDALEHPTTGLGHPERLKHRGGKEYSREIDKKNRLVYKILSDNSVLFDSYDDH